MRACCQQESILHCLQTETDERCGVLVAALSGAMLEKILKKIRNNFFMILSAASSELRHMNIVWSSLPQEVSVKQRPRVILYP